MKRVLHRVISRLFLWACQRSLEVEGSMDRAPATALVRWNNPTHGRGGAATPIFALEMRGVKGTTTVMVIPPKQFALLLEYGSHALFDQAGKFDYDVSDAPDFDVRWITLG